MRSVSTVCAILMLGCSGGNDGPACDRGTRATNCTVMTTEDLTDTCSGYTEVTGMLAVSGTDAVTLEGMECLQTLGDALNVTDNPSLVSLEGLDSLTTVGGAANIDGNGSLQSLDGLQSLSSVGGYLQVMDNASMDSLDGLRSLTTVEGDLLILSNDSLSSIEALSSLDTVTGGSIIITSNPMLPTCQAQALADRLTADGFDGTVLIAHNDDTATCD